MLILMLHTTTNDLHFSCLVSPKEVIADPLPKHFWSVLLYKSLKESVADPTLVESTIAKDIMF